MEGLWVTMKLHGRKEGRKPGEQELYQEDPRAVQRWSCLIDQAGHMVVGEKCWGK